MPENKLKELKLTLTHEEAVILKVCIDIVYEKAHSEGKDILNSLICKLLIAETEALDKLRNEVGRGGV